MSSDLTNRILAAVPIENYIGRYVRLTRAGHSLKGLCPFHKEKTPSFTVSPDKGLFYCFGCGKGGDIFRFVMDQEAVSFVQALDILARFAGIEQKVRSKKSSNRYEDRLAQLNSRVSQTFCDFLHSPEGLVFRQYLNERGLKEESIRFFQLGASPERWQWLEERYTKYEKELLDLGLLRQKKTNQDSSTYDFFRHRLIFPILAADKRVVGFGGRALPGQDKQAKYINSSESPLFKKGKLLYGLAQNLSQLRSRQEALVVEGYLDVIGLWQIGKAYACAPLGTSLTGEHLQVLSRYVKSATFVFDGDSAGIKAIKRALKLSLQQVELECRVCLMPIDQDPFDLCVSGSAAQMDILLEHRIDAANFFLMETMLPGGFQQYCSSQPQSVIKDAASFASLTKRYFTGQIPSIFPQGMQKRGALQKLYADLVDFDRDTDCRLLIEGAACLLGLDPVELQQEWGRLYGKNRQKISDTKLAGSAVTSQTDSAVVFSAEKEEKWLYCERGLLLEILMQPGLTEKFYHQLSKLEFEDAHTEFLWRHLEARYLLGNMWTVEAFASFALPEDTRQVFAALISRRLDQGDGNSLTNDKEEGKSLRVLQDYLLKHAILKNEKKLDEIGAYISVADPVQRPQLLAQKGTLLQELSGLKAKWRSQAG